MPEGDTIHKMARRLRELLAGSRVVRFELRRAPRGTRPPQPGAHVTTVEARGKHLLLTFDDGTTLHTHMQMTGAWHVYQPGERWRRPGHRASVVLEVDGGTTAVCFDAPVVELRKAGVDARPTRASRALEQLGPDLCTERPDLDLALANLERVDPATPIGAALLDQRVASGIGNVFASEICWAQRVHPARPLAAIDAPTRRALYETAHRMLATNVDTNRRTTHGGSLAVYGRVRRPCPRCSTPIRTARMGEPPRAKYWCPGCQPESGQDDVDR